MLTTILFDLDGTLAPFAQDEFIRVYFKALVSRATRAKSSRTPSGRAPPP